MFDDAAEVVDAATNVNAAEHAASAERKTLATATLMVAALG